jgi:hypothetical protein
MTIINQDQDVLDLKGEKRIYLEVFFMKIKLGASFS